MKTMGNSIKILIFIGLAFFSNSIAQNLPLFDSTWYGFNIGSSGDSRYPRASRMCDIDNDGDSDIVAALFPWGRGFAVIKNSGNGFFPGPNTFYQTAKAPLDIFTADLNNDNKVDIIVPNTGDVFFPPPGYGTTVSIYINLGNGSFGTPINVAVGTSPVGVVAADFDNDNDNDIAVANYGHNGQGNTVTIIVNNGNGTFTPSGNYPAGESPYKLSAAKINDDNLIDLVIANDNQKLNVLINGGANNFSNRTEYNVLPPNTTVVYPVINLADIDNDTDTDILYSNVKAMNDSSQGVVVLLKNNGNGTFGSTIEVSRINNVVGGRWDIETADLNNDGWKDIISTEGGYLCIISLNDGAGNFPNSYPETDFLTFGLFTNDLMVCDVDNNGYKDILAIDRGSLQVMVRRNDRNGIFPHHSTYRVGDLASFIDAADIDNDNDLDILTSANGFSAATVGVPVGIIKNNGNGTFGSNTLLGMSGVSAKFADLNNDGKKDIYFASHIGANQYNFHTALNLGNGNFGPVSTWTMNACGWFEIDAVDLNNDNYLDLVGSEALGCAGGTEKRIFISLNQGNGTFGSRIIQDIIHKPMPLVSGDFNRDGKMDIITGHPNSIEIHLGIGDGHLQPPVEVIVNQDVTDIVVADFNNDAKIDIATSDANIPTYGMSVLLGNGDGTFQQAQNYIGAYADGLNNSMTMTAGDVDNDSDIDVILGNASSNDLCIYLNNGNGTNFGNMMRYGSTYIGCFSPYFADFDGDSIKDIAFTAKIDFHPLMLTYGVMILKGKDNIIGIQGNTSEIPGNFILSQNYPNPFNPSTRIRFGIPQSGNNDIVKITVYDVTGREISTLVNETLSSGTYEVTWNGTNYASGLYFYRITAGNYSEVKKMVLIK